MTLRGLAAMGWRALPVYLVAYLPGWAGVRYLMGTDRYWMSAGLLLFVFLLAIAAVVLPSGAPWLQLSSWESRKGLRVMDVLVLAGVLLFGFIAATALIWRPLALVMLLLALLSVLSGVDDWELHDGRRDIPIPHGVRPAASDVSPRSWTWISRPRGLQSRVSVGLRESLAATRAAENPSNAGLATDAIDATVRNLVEGGAADDEVTDVARQLLDFARTNRFTYFEEAQNTLQLAQCIPYRTDEESKGKEYFRYPIETMADNEGDCDCKAILAAALFRAMGLRSVVMLSWKKAHAAVAVEGAPDYPGHSFFMWKGAPYYFCETTDASFAMTVGSVPPGYDVGVFDVTVEIEPHLYGAPI